MSLRNRLQMDSLESRVVLSAMGQPMPDYAATQGDYIDPSELNYLPSWQIGSQQQSQSGQTSPDYSWLPTTDPGFTSVVVEQINSQSPEFAPEVPGMTDLPLTVDDDLNAVAEDLQNQQIVSQTPPAQMPVHDATELLVSQQESQLAGFPVGAPGFSPIQGF